MKDLRPGLGGALRWSFLPLVLVGVFAGAGCRPDPYACATDTACVFHGVAGQCAAGARCAFPDDQCATGFRYADLPEGQRQPCAPSRGGSDAGLDTGKSDSPSETACIWSGLVSGNEHTCVIRNAAGTDRAAQMFCFGDNSEGQLGDGTLMSRVSATAVSTPASPVAIAAGNDHTCVLDAKRAVWCWGSNANGQLGFSGLKRTSSARAVPEATDVDAVVAGANHTCILRRGAVLCWGDNRRRQLATSAIDEAFAPLAVAGLPKIVSLAAGEAFTCALSQDGQVWCWGDNQRYQINGSTSATITTPTRRPDVTGAKQVVAGARFACVRVASPPGGQISCWGENQDGQVGRSLSMREADAAVVPGLPPIRDLAAGEAHACATTEQRTLFCWGRGNSGQIGTGGTSDSFAPVLVPGLSGVERVALGLAHSCAFTSGGLLCWGLGNAGQLGNGVRLQSNLPVQASNLNLIETVATGRAHNCARLVDSTVMCWGAGGNGQLGNGARSDRSVPGPVGGLNGIVQLALGGDLSCALSDIGAVQCWGRNDEGQVGGGDITAKSRPTAVPLPGKVDEIAVGGGHACARIGGTIQCWGHGDCGEMGDGTMNDRLIPAPVPGIGDARSLALGDHQTCVVRQGGQVLCWGDGASGVFGSQTGKLTTPQIQVDFGKGIQAVAGPGRLCVLNDSNRFVCRGGGVNADHLPVLDTTLKSLEASATVVALARGHACTLGPPGTLACLGNNEYGQLGSGDFVDAPTARVVRIANSAVKSVGVGDDHACAVIEGGSVFCFGSNLNGQLGDGERFIEAMPITTPLPCEPNLR